MPDLYYRPNKFDDWGIIRNADGSIFATVRRPVTDEEMVKHRSSGSDPYEDLALRLMSTFNVQISSREYESDDEYNRGAQDDFESHVQHLRRERQWE